MVAPTACSDGWREWESAAATSAVGRSVIFSTAITRARSWWPLCTACTAAWNAAAPLALAASTRRPAAVSSPIRLATRETRFSEPFTAPVSDVAHDEEVDGLTAEAGQRSRGGFAGELRKGLRPLSEPGEPDRTDVDRHGTSASAGSKSVCTIERNRTSGIPLSQRSTAFPSRVRSTGGSRFASRPSIPRCG